MIILNGCNGSSSSSNLLKLSLWLIPQEPDFANLKHKIDHLSQTYGLPTFDPHVTIVGGEVIDNESDAKIILKRLQCTFKDFGPIQCSFSSDKVLHGLNNDDNGEQVKWNQSCVAILDPSKKFNDAVYLAHRCFHPYSSSDEEKIVKTRYEAKGPPHFSFAYGLNDPKCCMELKPPDTFICTKAVLYWTYPSCLKGVPQWKPIDEIHFN